MCEIITLRLVLQYLLVMNPSLSASLIDGRHAAIKAVEKLGG